MKYWQIRIVKDGHARLCVDVNGFPVQMIFEPATAACQPFHFGSQSDAQIFWGLYQKAYPADASDWIPFFEEVEI